MRSASDSLDSMRLPMRIISAVLAVCCLVGVSACSSDTTAPSPTQSAELSPTQRLAAAKANVDKASSFHLKLTSADLPANASGVISGRRRR